MFKNILVFVLAYSFICTNGFARKKTIKFASLAPDGSTWTVKLKEFAKKIEKKTKIDFKIYPGGLSGDEFAVIKKMNPILGKIHSAGFTGVGIGKILPSFRVLDLPMLFKNYEEIDHINEKLKPYFEKEFEKKGYIFLGYAEVGFVNLFTTKKYTSLEAMRGMKMWVWDGDPLAKAMFKQLSISPNPLPITDVFTSLQTGLIESVYVSPLAAIAMQWFTKTKYMLTLKLTNSNGAILMTKAKFKKFSKKEQKYLKDEFNKFSKELNAATRTDNEKAYETLKKNGVKFVDISKKEYKIFENSSISLYNKMSGELYPRKLLTKVLRLRKKFREDKAKEKKKDEKKTIKDKKKKEKDSKEKKK